MEIEKAAKAYRQINPAYHKGIFVCLLFERNPEYYGFELTNYKVVVVLSKPTNGEIKLSWISILEVHLIKKASKLLKMLVIYQGHYPEDTPGSKIHWVIWDLRLSWLA